MTLIGYKWHSIEPLEEKDHLVDLSEIDSLHAAWKQTREDLNQFNPVELREFHDQLLRSWSIETGIIERIYDLDEGTTQTLVERGFLVDLIDRSSTNLDPAELVVILNDQREAAQYVSDAIAQHRPLTRGFLNELHALLTRHQPTTHAIDQFGNILNVPLISGEFKLHPNNPTRRDGTVHEYCPPLQVSSEIDTLLTWLNSYQNEHPIIKAAWLHHRFAQIHPYQDGNGRVARCLVTLVLLHGHFLPIVIGRHNREDYIDALEQADAGNLSGLTRLFAELEKKILLRAISIAGKQTLAKDYEVKLVEQVAQSIASRLQQRKNQERTQLRGVNHLAEQLLAKAKTELNQLVEASTQLLNAQNEMSFDAPPFNKERDEGGPHVQAREYYYRNQVEHTARDADQWANFNEAHYWLRRSLQCQDSRLTFVVSWHHVGRELTGVMEVTSFGQISYQSEEANNLTKDFVSCMLNPFTFTWSDHFEGVSNRFQHWLNECFAIALQHWGDTL